MTQQTSNDIKRVNFASVPSTENPVMDWTKNHGKFVHEFTYKKSKEAIIKVVNDTVNNLEDSITETITGLIRVLNDLNKDVENETDRASKAEGELQKQINQIIERLTTVENDLKGFHETYNTDVGGIKKSLSSLSETVNNLSSDVSSIKAGLANYATKQDLQTAIDSIKPATN